MRLLLLVAWVLVESSLPVKALSSSSSRQRMTAAAAAGTTTSRRTFRGVLFDLDGTLLDSEPLGCKAIYLALQDKLSPSAIQYFTAEETNQQGYLYAMPWEIKRQTLGLPGPAWAPLVLKYYQARGWFVSDAPSVDDFLTEWDRHMHAHMHEIGTCKGAVELVTKLAKKLRLPMAIATSSTYHAVQQKRKRNQDLFGMMTEIVATDDPAVRKGKPAPDIYVEAARRIDVDPTECIVFEDGLAGVRAGKVAGCFVVAVPDPRFSREERSIFEQEADVVLEDLTQFDGRWLDLLQQV